MLPDRLKQVDNYLHTIRNNGRQSFIENPSDNYSRILHDYSNDKKGFIIWKLERSTGRKTHLIRNYILYRQNHFL